MSFLVNVLSTMIGAFLVGVLIGIFINSKLADHDNNGDEDGEEC